LEKVIFELLNDTYFKNSAFDDSPQSVFLTGADTIKAFLEENIRNEIVAATREIDIFMSLDITTVAGAAILGLYSKMKKEDIRINITATFSVENNQNNNHERLGQAFILMNKFYNLGLELYDAKDFQNFNTICVNNKALYLFSLKSDGSFESIAHSKNKTQITKIHDTIRNMTARKTKLLGNKDTDLLIREAFRTNFYTNSSFNFLIINGFEFFLPPCVINNIMKFAEENNFSKADLFNMRKLMITWDEMFKDAAINFFILKSAIFKSFQNRKIFLMNVEYKMSPLELKMHYPYFVNIAKANDKISFYLIDDEKLGLDPTECRIFIGCNNDTVFLKNIQKLHKKEMDFFSIITNNRLVCDINLIFEEMKRSPYCRKVTIEEIETSWEKYKNMLFRIMEIDKEIQF
jgi:hypothetical protein